MKIAIQSIVFLTIICLFSNCNLEQYDEPEIEPLPSPTLGSSLNAAIVQVAYNQQAIAGRSAGALMQQLQGTESFRMYTTYNFSPSFMDSYWSVGMYQRSIKYSNSTLRLAQDVANSNAEAMARILLAIDYGHATTMYGNLPFSEANQIDNGILQPRFDTQEDVYKGIIEHLELAIAAIKTQSAADLASADVLANGQMVQWTKLAHGLLARYKLQLSNRQPELLSDILDHISQSFVNADDQLEFAFQSNFPLANPLHTFLEQRPGALVAGDFMVSMMEENQDPRRAYYYNLQSSIPPGTEDGYWTVSNASAPVVAYAELMFMKAEVLLRQEADDSMVSEALREAIQSNMRQVDPLQTNDLYIEEHADLSDFSNQQEKLGHIMSEAYIAYYGYAFHQVWNNYRRTGYPVLTSTGVPSPTNTSGDIPKRFFYPAASFLDNETNVLEAISRQGGDNLDNDLWVFE